MGKLKMNAINLMKCKKTKKILKCILLICIFMIILLPTNFAKASSNAKVITWNDAPNAGTTLNDNTIYKIGKSLSINSARSATNGLKVASGATVTIYVPTSITLSVYGGHASGQAGGYAGIYVPSNATLIITGSGTINAIGGNAANGGNGQTGGSAYDSSGRIHPGYGGAGGYGGGGAGAGIGTNGGYGGSGGLLASEYSEGGHGQDGWPRSPNSNGGGNGVSSGQIGSVYKVGNPVLNAKGGLAGSAGRGGSGGATSVHTMPSGIYRYGGAGGGGGGGGGGFDAAGVGTGGGGAGGGGGGSTGGVTDREGHKTPRTVCGTGGNGGGGYGYRGSPGNNDNGSEWRYGESNNGGSSIGGASSSRGSGEAWENATVYAGYPGHGGSRGAIGATKAVSTLSTHPMLQYTVTLDNSGADVVDGSSSVTVTLGASMPNIPTLPQKRGYDFNGFWSQKNAVGNAYYNKSGGSLLEWNYTENMTLYASWKNTIFTYNTPSSIKENELTASVTYTPADKAEYESQVGATVTLSGTADKSGMHVVHLTSNTIGVDFDVSIITQVPKGGSINEMQTKTFKIPSHDITDMKLTHTFIPMPDIYNQTYTFDNTEKLFSIPSSFNSIKVGTLQYEEIGTGNIFTTAPKNVGEYNVSIPLEIAGSSKIIYLTKQLTIVPKLLEWDVSDLKASDKEYNGNANASISGNIKIKGILAGNDVTIEHPEITKGFFDTPMAEKSKIISVDVSNVNLKGKDAKNYVLSTISPTLRADITGIEPMIDIKNNNPERTYDGTIQELHGLINFTDPNVKEIILNGTNESNLHYMYYTNASCTSVTTTDHGAITEGSAPSYAGNYWVRVTYLPDESQAQYSNKVSNAIAFTIKPKAILATVTWQIDQEGYIYERDKIAHEFVNVQLKPKVDVYEDSTNTLSLKEGVDYSVTYDDNIEVTSNAKAIITMKGNYKGSVKKEFSIIRATYDMTPVTMSNQIYTYDKQSHNVTIDDIYALLKIDTNLSVSYTYEGINGTSYAQSETPPTEQGEYRVSAKIMTTSKNWKFPGVDENSYEINSSLKIKYANKKITFDLNGGAINGDTSNILWEDAPQYKQMKDYPGGVPNPKLEGYELSAWESDGVLYSGKKINEEEIQKNRTYKAIWIEKKVGVNFEANGGKFQDNEVKKRYEQLYNSEFEFNKVAIPTNNHYIFKGWGTTADATIPLTGNFKFNDVSVDGKNYYAIWETDTYDVTLHYNGGKNNANDEQTIVNVLYGKTIGTIEEPKIDSGTSFTFKGWMNPNDALVGGSAKLYTTSELSDEEPSKDTVYIAIWDGDTINLQFDDFNENRDTVTYSVPKLSSGVKAASPKPISATGSIFKNWKVTKSDDTSIAVSNTYKEDEIFNLSIKENVTFKAEYDLESYRVQFDLNSGDLQSGEVSQTVQYNKSPTEVTAKKKGYILFQWLNMATGKYIDANDLKLEKIKTDTVYVAQWKEDLKSITLDANEGAPNKTIQIKKGEAFNIDTIAYPSKKNNNFIGWASTLDKANNGEVDIKGTQTIAEDITYYAVWSNVKYEVLFQNADGSVIEKKEILKDAIIGSEFLNEPVSAQVEGSTFKGWKQEAETTLKQWSDIRKQQVEDAVTFTASFDVNSYQLNFDVNGGSEGPNTIKENYGKEILLGDYKTPKAPLGYTFAGWYDQPIGGKLITKYSISADKTVYAHYVTGNANYTIEYYEKNLDDITYTMVKEEPKVGITDDTVIVKPVERVGFRFEESNTTYETSSNINSAAPLPIEGDGSLKIRVYYERNEYSVSYTTEGNPSASIPEGYNTVYKYGENIEIKPRLQSDGYGFEGWHSNGITMVNNHFKMPANDVELHGKFYANMYMVRYEVESETGSSIVDNTKYQVNNEVTLTTVIPKKEGYRFVCWKSDDVDLKDKSIVFEMPAKDVKIYAEWEKDEYELTFDSKGGSDVETINGIRNEVIKLPVAPIRQGYQFAGWICDDAVYASEASYVITSRNKKFEADWKSAEYTLTYKLDEGLFDKAVRTSYAYGDEFEFDIPHKDGYAFDGWYEDKELSVSKSEISSSDEQDFTLYAKWSKVAKETYDVTYHSNDGKTYSKATYQKGKQDLLIPSPRNNYVFDGWYLESEFKTKVESLTGKDAEEVELYGKWTPFEKITDAPKSKDNTINSSSEAVNHNNKQGEALQKDTVQDQISQKNSRNQKEDKEPINNGKKNTKPIKEKEIISWWMLLIALFIGTLIPITYRKYKVLKG